MKERPIIFNADMVEAILDGRKIQTRRVLTSRHIKLINAAAHIGECYPLEDNHDDSQLYYRQFCPFGQIGDRLWVRETWWQAGYGARPYPESDEYEWVGSKRAHYAVDGPPPNEPNSDYPSGLKNGSFSAANPNRVWRKRPSIHMPRWASRINLEVTNVRVERLKDISEEDAIAEGCDYPEVGGMGWKFKADFNFKFLWKKIYGEDSFDANPWVWVLEFKRL